MAYMIPSQLKLLRERQRKNKRQIANDLNLAYSTYNNWETGVTEPNSDALSLLSDYFGVSIDFIMGRPTLTPIPLAFEEKSIISKYRTLDTHGKETVEAVLDKEHERMELLKEEIKSKAKPDEEDEIIEMKVFDEPAAAGLGNYLDSDTFELMTFSADKIPYEADFGVRISGDSMEPEIKDGSIVWVQALPVIENGDIGIFVLNNEAYCKELHIDRRKKIVSLISVNKNYKPIKINAEDDLRTIGKVLLN